MRTLRFARTLAGVALAATAMSALAAEMTLFDERDFRGGRITLRGETPNFDRSGFNDRAASAVIREGTWEVCTDARFQGRCATLRPGEYANLEGSLNDSISSARPVNDADVRPGRPGPGYGGTPPGHEPPPPPQRPPGQAGGGRAVLYEGPGFQGRAFAVERDVTRSLDRSGFNDRAQSLRVESGYWMFCSDADFEGDCRTFGPGEYAQLPGDLNRRISSGRRISDRYPYGGQPSWDNRR